jgi:hypothetical protein
MDARLDEFMIRHPPQGGKRRITRPETSAMRGDLQIPRAKKAANHPAPTSQTRICETCLTPIRDVESVAATFRFGPKSV